MRWVIAWYLLNSVLVLGAQDKEELHQFYQFKDGIYLTHQTLMKNAPKVAIEQSSEDLYINDAKILRINPKNFGVNYDSLIKYVVYEGLPHLNVTRCCPNQVAFVGLTVLGALSLAYYDSEEIVDIPMIEPETEQRLSQYHCLDTLFHKEKLYEAARREKGAYFRLGQ